MGIKVWLDDVRTRLRPTAYVDYSNVPEGPECPYRARITTPVESGTNELDVREREIVLCPRCGRAVLVMQPGLAAD